MVKSNCSILSKYETLLEKTCNIYCSKTHTPMNIANVIEAQNFEFFSFLSRFVEWNRRWTSRIIFY